MLSLKQSLKGIVSDAKLENSIAFSQAPLIDLVNKYKTRYPKLHILEGKPGTFYNAEPLWDIISGWIKNSYLLSSTDSGMFFDVQNLSNFDLWREKGSIGGLCEILCDWLIKSDCLRNRTAFIKVFTDNEPKELLDRLSSDASFFRRDRWLKEKSFHKSHGYYPKDYVSCEDHKHIMTKDEVTGKYQMNNEVLRKSLDKVKPGYYATLYFTRPSDTGHAMLVKRSNNKEFSFFDPNYIALFDVTKEEVSNAITKILELLYPNVNFEDLGIIERGKGISENLATDNKSTAKSAKEEVQTLLSNPNISMLTYKQLKEL